MAVHRADVVEPQRFEQAAGNDRVLDRVTSRRERVRLADLLMAATSEGVLGLLQRLVGLLMGVDLAQLGPADGDGDGIGSFYGSRRKNLDLRKELDAESLDAEEIVRRARLGQLD